MNVNKEKYKEKFEHLYNFKYNVDYFNKDNNISLIKYQNDITEVLAETDENNFSLKCDIIYEFINEHNEEFMSDLLERTLTINRNKIIPPVSNSMYFYLCCSSLSSLKIDSTKDFNANEYINNPEYRKMIFGFLFSHNCFYYLHQIIQMYINSDNYITYITSETNNVNIHNTYIKLSESFNSMFNV